MVQSYFSCCCCCQLRAARYYDSSRTSMPRWSAWTSWDDQIDDINTKTTRPNQVIIILTQQSVNYGQLPNQGSLHVLYYKIRTLLTLRYVFVSLGSQPPRQLSPWEQREEVKGFAGMYSSFDFISSHRGCSFMDDAYLTPWPSTRCYYLFRQLSPPSHSPQPHHQFSPPVSH